MRTIVGPPQKLLATLEKRSGRLNPGKSFNGLNTSKTSLFGERQYAIPEFQVNRFSTGGSEPKGLLTGARIWLRNFMAPYYFKSRFAN
jgi:hypothetical protein